MGGGGVVAEMFGDHRYRIRFSHWGGGGVVEGIFHLLVNHIHSIPGIFLTFSGLLRIARRLWTLTEIQAHFPCLLTHSKKNICQKFGGGHGPGYATACRVDEHGGACTGVKRRNCSG